MPQPSPYLTVDSWMFPFPMALTSKVQKILESGHQSALLPGFFLENDKVESLA